MTRRRPWRAPRPPHPDGFHRAVEAELRRITLGGRPERPELPPRPRDRRPPQEETMSDLTTFRDHCRKMAKRVDQSGDVVVLGSDRQLWEMLADEVDAYLEQNEAIDLFGEVSPEPPPSTRRRR